MTNPPPPDQTCFGHLVLALWNFALGEPAEGRIQQGKNLKFVCNLVLGVWDFIDSITPTYCRDKVIHSAQPMPVVY